MSAWGSYHHGSLRATELSEPSVTLSYPSLTFRGHYHYHRRRRLSLLLLPSSSYYLSFFFGFSYYYFFSPPPPPTPSHLESELGELLIYFPCLPNVHEHSFPTTLRSVWTGWTVRSDRSARLLPISIAGSPADSFSGSNNRAWEVRFFEPPPSLDQLYCYGLRINWLDD